MRQKQRDFLESIWSAAADAAADELTGAATDHPHKITSAKYVTYPDTIFLPAKLCTNS